MFSPATLSPPGGGINTFGGMRGPISKKHGVPVDDETIVSGSGHSQGLSVKPTSRSLIPQETIGWELQDVYCGKQERIEQETCRMFVGASRLRGVVVGRRKAQ